MANYVANKIICSEEFYEKYLLDYKPFGEEDKEEYYKKNPYITFNKLYGVKDIGEYSKKYGEYIYYGYGYSVRKIENGFVEIKFKTRWHYPICAIIQAIKIDTSVIWYVCEENNIYISKFTREKDKLVEKILQLETKEYKKWYYEKIYEKDEYENLEDADDYIWYFDCYNEKEWIKWESKDLIEKYKEQYPSEEFYEFIKNKEQ